jgi:hypothetical protein
METKIVKLTDKVLGVSNGLTIQHQMRSTPLKEWLKQPNLSGRLSGTLKKNASIGFKHISQLNHEALCQTLGWGFESAPTTYITFNDAITEGDCHSLTEVGWHVDRMLNIHPFDEDVFELKYIIIQDAAGNIERQGVGVVLKETSIQWVMGGHLIFALLTEYDLVKQEWTDCVNPF